MSATRLPTFEELMQGGALFPDSMPVFEGQFGQASWLLLKRNSPLFRGEASSSIVWGDYINGRGATFGGANSVHRSKYNLCLTPEIVRDLKVAAIIHAYHPGLVKNARIAKKAVDPFTVKGRIDELARIFSAAVMQAAARDIAVRRLSDISFSLLKEVVSKHPGRGSHLKRALKLISAPVVQKNLSAPLQWQLVDLEEGSMPWPVTKDGDGIETLPDTYFLAIQDYCLSAIRDFKVAMGQSLHCKEIGSADAVTIDSLERLRPMIEMVLQKERSVDIDAAEFKERFGLTTERIEEIIIDAQCAAIMIVLLFTGMRRSETQYLLNGSLVFEKGYWFIKSKVVKHRKKDAPISEGWLAIDVVRDAYEVLSYFCGFTKNKYLISSPFRRFSVGHRGYAASTLNTKLNRWLRRINVDDNYVEWNFSVHQCRETLVAQLANQQVKLPFISMQLKHFHSRFNSMPNEVTVGYGNYCSQLMASVATRLPQAREFMIKDMYGEEARFAGGGGDSHKARVDAFFSGMGLFGAARENYLEALARRSSRFQPTSIGACVKNFELPVQDAAPPCYGDFECDPDCSSHVITERGGRALRARRDHALLKAQHESNTEYKVIWMGLVEKLGRHVARLDQVQNA